MLRFLLAALLVLSAGGVAHAASHDRATFIRDQDLDGDGRVTKAEYITGRAQEFARIDADHDKGLSLTEYVTDFGTRVEAVVIAAGVPPEGREKQKAVEMSQVPTRFKVIDLDGSGKISVEEFDTGGWRIFNLHETDGDGVVTRGDPLPKG